MELPANDYTCRNNRMKYSNRAVNEVLVTTCNTIENHLKHILQKLLKCVHGIVLQMLVLK